MRLAVAVRFGSNDLFDWPTNDLLMRQLQQRAISFVGVLELFLHIDERDEHGDRIDCVLQTTLVLVGQLAGFDELSNIRQRNDYATDGTLPHAGQDAQKVMVSAA